MKRLKFLENVRDKYTNERYKQGKEYEFKNERADEILKTNKAILVEEVIETATKKEKVETAVKRTKKKSKQ